LELPQLSDVAGELSVYGNGGLTSITLGSLVGVQGNISVTANPLLESLSFSALEDHDGKLTVSSNGSLTSLSLAELTAADAVGVGTSVVDSANPGAVIVARYLSSLQHLDLSGLTTVASNMELRGMNGLTSVALGALSEVHGDLTVHDNPLLPAQTLPALSTVGGVLSFGENDALQSVELPALSTAGAVRFFANYSGYGQPNCALTSVSLPGLTSVSDRLVFSNCPYLQSVSLPSLAGSLTGTLSVTNCDAMTSFTAPLLTSVGRIAILTNALLAELDLWSLGSITTADPDEVYGIMNNTEYPQCLAEALLAQVTTSADVKISGNREDCTCQTTSGVVTASCP
jgi:hypothetical protein